MDKDLQVIQEYLGTEETPVFVQRLTGGDINDVFLVEINHERVVVKKNEERRFPGMLEKEFRALVYLRENSPARYPNAIESFVANGFQYLLLEYVEPANNSDKGQRSLGRLLAQQHAVSNEFFGWEEDNYIGSLSQQNDMMSSWSDFYAEQRLLFQAKMAFDSGVVDRTFVTKMERFCSKLPELFPQEKPALLHGDLWGGNYFIGKNDIPLLYDPAVYFGHREIDIAMTRLFGGFSSAFYQGYNEENSLESGWEERIPLGQLYPNMVHLNLFGTAYLGAVTTVIDRF